MRPSGRCRKTTNRLRAIETGALFGFLADDPGGRKTTNRLRAIETTTFADPARLRVVVARPLIAFGRLKPDEQAGQQAGYCDRRKTTNRLRAIETDIAAAAGHCRRRSQDH